MKPRLGTSKLDQELRFEEQQANVYAKGLDGTMQPRRHVLQMKHPRMASVCSTRRELYPQVSGADRFIENQLLLTYEEQQPEPHVVL